ncbi:MAG: NfeD family protein [Planctomycetota bacterium]|nr:NfeD family protein [Planctomycetota bacterium]
MDNQLLVGLLLLLGSLLLFGVEAFVPSAGLISLLALGLAGGGIYMLWSHDPLWGLGALLAMIVLAPTIFFTGLNMFRHTPAGRRLIGEPTEEELEQRRLEEEARLRERLVLVGKQGRVISALRPVGVVEIEGVRHDAISESGVLDPGTPVRVTHATATEVKVRQV